MEIVQNPSCKATMRKNRVLVAFIMIFATYIMAQVLLFKSPATKGRSRKSFSPDQREIIKSSEAFEEEREKRMKNIARVCNSTRRKKKLSDLSRSEKEVLFKHLIVSDKYEFLYCYIPKVGCSNWKKVIKYMHGVTSTVEVKVMDHQHGLRFLWEYSEEEIRFRLNNYFKFTFVRDPLARMLSAYKNKFGEIESYMSKFGKPILDQYRRNNTPEETYPHKITADDVTFDEFIRYVIGDQSSIEAINEHWLSMTSLCQPCVVNYTYTGSYENLMTDANDVLEIIKAPPSVKYPTKQSYYNVADDSSLSYFYSLLPKPVLKNFLRKFSDDFFIFSFPTPLLST